MRCFDIVERVTAGNVYFQRAIHQRAENIVSTAPDFRRIAQMIRQSRARQEQRAGFAETASFVSAGRRPTMRAVTVGAAARTDSRDATF